MKNLLLKTSVVCLVLAAIFACNPVNPEDNGQTKPDPDSKPEPGKEASFSVSLKEVGADYVLLDVESSAEFEIAYTVVKEKKAYSGPVLFATGTTAKAKNGDVITIKDGIEADTKYYLYAVAKFDSQNYSAIIELEFQTEKYEFSEMLSIVETYWDGYKIHITVPAETKERGNVIRYGGTSFAWYNVLKNASGVKSTDLNAVVATGDPMSNYVKNDSTLVRNNDNVVVLDKNGNPVLDEYGQQIDIHDPIVPGEPSVFIAGECKWGSPEEFNKVVGYYMPTTDSYSIPLFDWDQQENGGWYGAFQKKIFTVVEPEKVELDFKLEIPEDEITVTDANIYFNMGEDVTGYFYMILDNPTYNQVKDIYLDGNESLFQWFLTSYLAYYEWGLQMISESGFVNAASSFYEPLSGGETYHVLCTVIGDEKALKQMYIHETFQAKTKTKRAPVIEVKALEENNPYNAGFNIKAPDKDVVGAYLAGNYVREFELYLNADYTYEDLLKMNYPLDSEDVAEINSDEGLTIYIPTLDGEATRLAVLGCNDEYTFNSIDEDTEGAGWADYQAPMAEKADPISSPYYSELAGDWTATARILISESDDEGNTVTREMTHKSKVTISTSAPELPAKVDDFVYDIYDKLGHSKSNVDNMFEELGLLTDQFTEYRLEGQNRLLCNGFVDFDYYSPSRVEYMSPYQLFYNENYNSYDIAQLIYDFGPKWFLEVQEDGSLIVPFDSMKLPVMHAWPGFPFYVGGLGYDSEGNAVAFYDSNEAYPGFPVEVSADYKKITVKPIVLKDGEKEYPYYMNAIGSDVSGLTLTCQVVSEVELTKGWTETKSVSTSAKPIIARPDAVTIDGRPVKNLPKAKKYKSMSDFSRLEPIVEYKEFEKANVLTMEMLNNTTEKIINDYRNRK